MGVYFDGEEAIHDGGKLPDRIKGDARFDRWIEAGIIVDKDEAKKIAAAKAKAEADEKAKVDAEMVAEAKKPGRTKPKRVQR